MYRLLLINYGVVDEDIESRGMGQQGVDIILSPAAKRYLDHSIECKKHKRACISKLFEQHYTKYKTNNSLKLLFSENNHSEPLVTMRVEDFMLLLKKTLPESTAYSFDR